MTMTMTTRHQHESQFATLSQALLKQKALGASQDETLAVMFMGEQFDSYPRELLLDNAITSLDKYAWQRLYIELQQNRHYFPSYDNLQSLWGNLGGLLSRKTVREVLSRLVLSGWLSFRVLRGENGQMVGNTYMLHNIRLSLIDIITQNDESVTHIFTSLLSKKDISKSLAILTYNQVRAYLASKGQSEHVFLQMNGEHKEMVITHNIDDIAPTLLAHLEKQLSSKKELSKNSLSSKKELSQNSPSSKLELPIKSMGYNVPSSTSSSICSSTTTNESVLVFPENIKARLTDKGMRDILNVIAKTGLDVTIANQIFASVSQGNVGSIKSMTAYLVRNIQKAAQGEYTVVNSKAQTMETMSQLAPHVVVDNAEPTQEAVAVADLSEEDLALLGIDGDTEKDTVQTLVTLVKSVRKQQVETDQKIKQLSAENEQLKRGVGTGGEYKINPPKSNEPNELEKQVSMLTDKLNSLTTKYANIGSRQNETNAAQSTGGASNNLPIGQGQAANTSESQTVETVNWIMPSDQMQIESSGRNDQTFSFPTSFNGNDPLRAKLKGYKDQINQPIGDKDDTQHDKVYTIAANATLIGSVSMTALLGRVPVDGVVNDPYPFKAVIGRDNLMANGIELPHVEGAIVSGTTSGDFVLSCVKGSVKSITFVFDDGRIRTIPDGKNSSREELGWISDEYGIPCVSGELKTNAQEYLSSIAALSTLGAAADAISQANTTVAQDSNGNITTMIDGDMGAYALGKGLSGGLQTTVDWFNKRYGQTFDAVYVPQGQTIAIHINKELDIDYFYNSRMVDYGVNTHKLGVLD